ncbi:hypothetical protein TNCV_1790031 [Trichonephila clavipes]|nr:hypothetical protein TNCV_1790031 [Trichonephila clavipes]
MFIQLASSQRGLVRGAVVLLVNSITVQIRGKLKRMEGISTQQLNVPNGIEDPKQGHEKTLQTMIEPPCPCAVPT